MEDDKTYEGLNDETGTEIDWHATCKEAWGEVTAATERADEWEVEAKRLARTVIDLTVERLDLKRQLADAQVAVRHLEGKPKS